MNLKDSLGGARQTAMIANINPSNLSLGETQNTWHWANGAKEMREKSVFCDYHWEIRLVTPSSSTKSWQTIPHTLSLTLTT